MPFLPPNQQRQSTEGLTATNQNAEKTLCRGKRENELTTTSRYPLDPPSSNAGYVLPSGELHVL